LHRGLLDDEIVMVVGAPTRMASGFEKATLTLGAVGERK